MKSRWMIPALLTAVFLAVSMAGCDVEDEECDCGDDGVGDDDAADPQREITEPAPLLNPDGSLAARGWARSPLMLYNPECIPESLVNRKKEWDHYTIVSPRFAFAVTISDIRLVTFVSVEVIDFEAETLQSGVDITIGSTGIMPLTPFGNTYYEQGDTFMTLEYEEGIRTFTGHIESSLLSPEFDCQIQVVQNPADDDLAAAAPFSQEGHFFYENKTLGMPASGVLTIDNKTYVLDPADTFAILDWGRGVWPHTHQWHWGSAAGYLDGGIIGFNIGDGWSDDSWGTANVQKIHGVIHKIYYVDFDYDPNQLMHPWHVVSDDGSLEVTFSPFFHQKAGMMIFDLGMMVDKMYGRFTGKMTKDDGTVVQFEDLVGFIEDAAQRW